MGMFEVVPDNPQEGVVVTGTRRACNPSEKMEFGERAIQEGFPSPIVRFVVADDNAYDSYESFIDAIMAYTDGEVKKVEQGEERKKKRMETIQKTVQVYSKYQDVENIFEQELYAAYNTTAVTLFDMVRLCTNKEDLDLDLYICSAFSIILQIKSDFVAKAVQTCLSYWATNKYVKKVIDSYLKDNGVDITNKQITARAKARIIAMLPKNIQNEVSPDEYKLFRVIQIENSAAHKAALKDIDTEEEWMNFGVYCETYMDCKTPYLAANALSVDRVLQHDEFYAQVIPFAFKPAKTFRKAYAHTLSLAGKKYFESKEEVSARKEEFKDLLESEDDVADLLMTAKVPAMPSNDFDWNAFTQAKLKPKQPAKQPVQQKPTAVTTQQTQQRVKTATAQQTRAATAVTATAAQRPQQKAAQSPSNYAPRTTGAPTKIQSTDFRLDTSALKNMKVNPVLAMGIFHIIVAAVMFLLLGIPAGVLPAVALIVAQGGFMRKMADKDKWLQPMVGGYAVTLLSALFL